MKRNKTAALSRGHVQTRGKRRVEMSNHKVVSRDEWLAAGKQHLSKEKEFTRLRDQLSVERRELPWVKVEKPYVFDGANGKENLSQLFQARSQLIVYHFMFHPPVEEAPGISVFYQDEAGGTVSIFFFS